MFKRSMIGGGLLAALLAAPASGQLFPNQPHAAYNFIPFGGGNGTSIYHQVFDAGQFGSDPFNIDSLGFSTNESLNGQTAMYDRVIFRLGYTDRTPGTLSANLPDNPRGPMTTVYDVSNFSELLQSNGVDHFNLVFAFTERWCYEPREGNLLVEIQLEKSTGPELTCSRSAGVPLASRAWNTPTFGNNADGVSLRMMFERSPCEAGVTIALSGSCPGPMTLRWTGAEPGRPAGVAIASGTGNFIIPGGPCVGTQLGLNSTASLLSPPGQFSTGPNGEGSFSGNAGQQACGRFLQMVVFQSGAPPCDTSNVVQIQ